MGGAAKGRRTAARFAATAALAATALLGACAHGDAASQALAQEPPLSVERWFEGVTVAHGFYEDRGGRARFGFRTWLQGRADAGGLTLRERFRYDDGQRWERTWRFARNAPGMYAAEADDTVGPGRMEVVGDLARMRYVADMPAGPGRTIRLRFDQRLTLLADGVLVNRADVFKFGVRVGRITMVFHRPGAADADALAIAAEPAYPTPHAAR